MSLNDVTIRNAKPRPKPYKLPREHGLYVIIYPNGAKQWRFSYHFSGTEKLLSFGAYPEVSLQLARERREEARQLLATGTNPSVHRRAEADRKTLESFNTFRVVAAEWLRMKEEIMAPVTYNKARWMLDFALPHIGSRPIAQIEPMEILALLRGIEASGKLETMHRVKSRISEVFRYGVATRRCLSDPCRDLRGALKPKRRTKHLAALTDPADVGALVLVIDGYRGTPEVQLALKLSPLVFVRPGELRHAEWPQFELDGQMPAWRYFVGKTRVRHIVPLSQQAVAILRELRKITGKAPTAMNVPHYVFPNWRTRHRPMSENAITAALRSLGYSGDQMTAHGFRATARTLLAELGWAPETIERQLAHRPGGSLGEAYDRAQFLDERRKMMQAWADYLDRLKSESDEASSMRHREFWAARDEGMQAA